MSSMHPALSRPSPLTFHKTGNGCTDSALAIEHLELLLQPVDPCEARRPWTTPSPDAPECIDHQRGPQGRPKAPPQSRRGPSYTTASLHPSATLRHDNLHYVSSSCPAKRKIQKQRNNKGNTLPLTLSLALWGRRWVLSSLSVPALVSTSVPPLPWHNKQEH